MSVVGYLDGYIDENNNEYGLTDTVAQGAITAIKDGTTIDSFSDVETVISGIKDGTTIDSFGDVETALADKADASDVTAIEGKIPSGASPSNKMATASDVASRVDWESYAKTGVHNLLPPTVTQTINNVVYTVNSDGTITVNNKPTSGNADLNIAFIPPKDGQYIVNGALSSNLRIHAFDRTTNDRPYADSTKTTINRNNAESPTDELSYYMLASHSYYITVRVTENYTASGEIFKPMVRIAADTDPTYAPYAMTNRELTENKVDKLAKVLTSSDDLDNIVETGIYYATTAPTHSPIAVGYYALIVMARNSTDAKQMVFFGNKIYGRALGGNPAAWSSWYEYSGTIVS